MNIEGGTISGCTTGLDSPWWTVQGKYRVYRLPSTSGRSRGIVFVREGVCVSRRGLIRLRMSKETGMLKDVLQEIVAGEYCGEDKAICNSQEELDSWLKGL